MWSQIVHSIVGMGRISGVILFLFRVLVGLNLAKGEVLMNRLLNGGRPSTLFRDGSLDNWICVSFWCYKCVSALVSQGISLSIAGLQVLGHHFIELFTVQVNFRVFSFVFESAMGFLWWKFGFVITIEEFRWIRVH